MSCREEFQFVDDGIDDRVPRLREADHVVYIDGVETARVRIPQLLEYVPDELGDRTSPETQAATDEVTARRCASLGKIVVSATFSSSGKAQLFDGEIREGELELVPVATYNLPASPPPPPAPSRRSLPRLALRLSPRVGSPSSGVATRPRERRARSTRSASRDGPGESDLDPPPRRHVRRWLLRLLRRRAS